MTLEEILVKHEILRHHTKTIVRRVDAYRQFRLDKILEDFPMLSPTTVAAVMSDYTQTPLFKGEELDITKIPVNWPKLKPRDTAAVPVFADEKSITVAVLHPQAEETQAYMHQLHANFKKHRIHLVISDRITRQTVFRLYHRVEDDMEKLQKYIQEVEALPPQSPKTEAKLNQVFVAIINTAVTMNASDIQLLATESFGQIQFKVEGTGHIVGEMTRDLYLRVTRKILSDLNVSPDAIKNKSTEASITSDTHGNISREVFRFFNFRCQLTMPEPKESDYTVITIRLLSRNLDLLSFEEAGFIPKQINLINQATDSVAGLVLSVGPVNSGKSTTLFGMLSQIDPVRRLIKTIENPIEFRSPLWEQNELGDTLTLKDEHLSYRQHIKGMVRKSPDCLLAGELRSAEESVEIFGLAYASTLCFSSLHAENIANAIGRLKFWGIPRVDIANVVRLIIAQRLVRRLCPQCKIPEKSKPNIAEASLYAKQVGITLSPEQIYTNDINGCDLCRHTGFVGRQLIAEILSSVEKESYEVLVSEDGSRLLHRMLHKNNRSMWHSGMRHVVTGMVSVGEVLRHAARISMVKSAG